MEKEREIDQPLETEISFENELEHESHE